MSGTSKVGDDEADDGSGGTATTVVGLPTSLGQKTAANSTSVVVNSDQLTAAQKLATEGKQDTGNTSLASIDTKASTGNASLSSLDTKASTGNASLGSIDTKATTSNTNTGATATSAASIDGKVSAAAAGADAESNATTIGTLRARLQAFNGTTWDRVKAGLTGLQTVVTGVLNVLPIARYTATRAVLSDTNAVELQSNPRGDLSVAEANKIGGEDTANDVMKISPKALSGSADAWTTYAAAAKVGTVGINVKAGAGRVRRIRVTNAAAATGYFLLLVNKASAPVNNDLPSDGVWVPFAAAATGGTGNGEIDYGPDGKYLGTGISYAISTTEEKVTLAGAADAMVYFDYA